MEQPRPGGTGFQKRSQKKKLTSYLELEKSQQFRQTKVGTTILPVSSLYHSCYFPKTTHEKVLPGTSLFHPEVSVNQPNQVKPTLLSLLLWNGLSGVSCFHCWRAIPLARIFGGECSPTTLVAVTTSYFSSRNFRQSLALTLLQKPVGFKVIYGRLHPKGTWLYLLLLCHRSASGTAGYLRQGEYIV